MHSNAPILYQNPEMGEQVTRYAQTYSTGLADDIVEYWNHVSETMPETTNWMISTAQAQALQFLAKMFGAKRVLEIGVYVGFSSLVWSSAVGKDGKVVGLELRDSFAQKARECFDKYGVDNVQVLVGDALEILPTLASDEAYDIIFIDAQKAAYPAYLEMIVASSQPGSEKRLLRPGGLIVGDNVLRCGFVADNGESNVWRDYDFGPDRKEYWKSNDIACLRRYNEAVLESDRLENWLCPLWDGMNLTRLVD